MSKKLKLKPIAEDLILDRMRFENPWWITGSIGSDYDKLPRRPYFDLFFPLVSETEVRRAVVLMGPRRVGKTVMMHHCIHSLLMSGIANQKICYIGIDNPIYLNISLDGLFLLANKAAGITDTSEWFVFFDEIQYLKDWEVHLKVLVDSYPHTRFIVSGSAAAALRLKSTESGAGRFTEFMLPPLTFHEYIHLKNYDGLIRRTTIAWDGQDTLIYTAVDFKEINRHFIDYINYGGYPEVIFSGKIQENPGRYIKSDIVDKVLLRDLPSLYGIQDVQELNSFFTMLAYYSGNEVSLDALSANSGVGKNLLKKYIEYLEAAFLIKVVHRVDDTAKKFQRATYYKIFLTNPSLRSALFSPLQPTDEGVGSMVETAIFAQWLHRDWFTPWYASWTSGRSHGEVDLVGLSKKTLKPNWALEIKWSNRSFEKPTDLKSLLEFCKKNNLKSALVTSLNKEGVKSVNGIELTFIPAAMYAYLIGRNTHEQKMNMGM
jgi:hypothetical protein